ncbi:hypothetical protein LCGC14_1130410 [marine sediment metagenome]|uniref:Uncharacterized protein n=1 Tax=marine sediment metagenome TaxID=412755 RepID=A0A0F9MP17_9ZZZZ
MTDNLLVIIIIIMLLQIHSREKNAGWYGHLYVIIKKRFIRRLIRFIYKWAVIIKEYRRVKW